MDLSAWLKAPTKLYNTPATFPIYVSGLNLAYMIRQGGLSVMAEKAKSKTQMLYDFIDNSDGYYINRVNPKYRSRMNVPFRVANDDKLEA
eukprot:CAMPEP_0116871680 /NCGR_PEP_ID=MMETSP0463-20121206/2150_1 /TAXON_ID=181622 /ORGANISM="Strombidinopsis sp, Strain SopsisLIS2011" /LENGTH=89 /DNA_ID=CAMNT_0004510583 /DNA_START=687 /DNA_END=956 /DNA_ORIENTATION=-